MGTSILDKAWTGPEPSFHEENNQTWRWNVMVWGCITGEGMGRLHHIKGIMNGPGYVDIL